MANIMLGPGVTDIRGKVAGSVFSRNKAGNYVRSNKKPVNPRSTRQSLRRANMAWLTKYWSSELTEQQRADWRAYAAGTGWTNKLGQAIEINGLAAFLRLNALEMLYKAAPHAAAPLAMGHAGGVTFTFAAESDTTKIQFDEPGGAWDKDTDDHHLYIFQGLPTEPGRISIPKGFRLMADVYGDLAAPLVFPLEVASAYTMTEGQRITMRAMFTDENFRVSGPHWATDLAAPSA